MDFQRHRRCEIPNRVLGYDADKTVRDIGRRLDELIDVRNESVENARRGDKNMWEHIANIETYLLR